MGRQVAEPGLPLEKSRVGILKGGHRGPPTRRCRYGAETQVARAPGGRQATGPGGAVDMMRGAGLSKGGRSIVALKATASAGKKSKIVSGLDMNTAATALRTDVDYVVTEYGARHIRHLPVTERAKALIELAAPEFRVQLSDEWQSMRTKT